MENTSYALHLAAGFIIAVMVIGLGMYVHRAMSAEQKAQDDIVAVKNKTEFNEAFLAYDKPLMYGADVLSCLNKAMSNNQRYVYNNYYGTDEVSAQGDDQHFINIEFTINSALQEKIEVYYLDENGKAKISTKDAFNMSLLLNL